MLNAHNKFETFFSFCTHSTLYVPFFLSLVGLTFKMNEWQKRKDNFCFCFFFERCTASSFTFPNQFIRCKHQQVIFCLLSITIIIILLRNCNRVYAFSLSLFPCVCIHFGARFNRFFYSGSLLHRAHMLTHEVQFFVVVVFLQ